MAKRSRGSTTDPTSALREPGLPWMTTRQLEAYLASRDAIRRIQRSSQLLDGAAPAYLPMRLKHRSTQ
jgi:hypothetical protein